MGLLCCLCNHVHPRCECCTWRAHVERSLGGYGALPLRTSHCLPMTMPLLALQFSLALISQANITELVLVATNGCDSLRANHLLAQVVDLDTIHTSLHAEQTAILPLLGNNCRHSC